MRNIKKKWGHTRCYISTVFTCHVVLTVHCSILFSCFLLSHLAFVGRPGLKCGVLFIEFLGFHLLLTP